jgi:hypothetical protein
MADVIKDSNTANIDQVVNVASKIVDATANTETNTNLGTPQVETGNTNLQEIKIQENNTANMGESITTNVTASAGTTNDQIVNAAKQGLEDLQVPKNTTPAQDITTGVQSKLNSNYVKDVYENFNDFSSFAKKIGYAVQEWKDKLFVNYTPVDWQSIGVVKDALGNFKGSLAQFQQILNNVKSAGYTSSLDFQNYAKAQGLNVGQNATNTQFTVNGKEVDFSQYASQGMKIVNGQWVGTEAAYKQIIKDITERSDKVLVDALKEMGMKAEIINNDLYINNKKVNWKDYGLKKVFANVVGTDEQYRAVADAIAQEGYSTKTLSEYAKSQGLEVTPTEMGDNTVYINGQVFDLTPYMEQGLNNVPSQGWGGTEEAYNQIITDAKERVPDTLDMYATQNSMSFQSSGSDVYINGRKITKDELANYGIQVINGKLHGTQAQFDQIVSDTKSQGYTSNQDIGAYLKQNKVKSVSGLDLTQFGLSQVNGQWVGSESQYKEVVNFLQTRSQKGLTDYVASKDHSVVTSLDEGKTYINGKLITDDYIKSFGLKVMNGKVWGSENQYNNLIQAIDSEGYTTNKDLGSYLGNMEITNGITKIDGKMINLGDYANQGLTNVDGQWVGSETVYKKIQEDAAARSDQTLDTYLSGSGMKIEQKDGKFYADGQDVTKIVNNSGLEMIDGKIVGTDAEFKNVQAKIEDPYTYKSAFEDEIQNALTEIKGFQAYQTPQETLDLINQLVKTAQEKFSYDPAADSALILAQKEAERQVREGSGSKGMLYSSGTMETVTRKAAELIPQFEQAAYNRFQAEQNRVMNVMNAVMQWDQMQADRKMDEFTIMNNKFNALLDLDSRALEQFKVVLDQRNADKQYELDLQKFALDKRAAEVEQAWATVNQVGYVDENTSAILGVPVGTKASWLKQVEEEQKNALALQQKQQEYDTTQQQKQYELDKSLVEYKASLDAANAEKLQAQENEYNRKLAIKESNQAIALQRPVVKSGSSGLYVKTVQQFLANIGFDCPVDGSFGPKTVKAVAKYQQDRGLPQTGVVDATTWADMLNYLSGV